MDMKFIEKTVADILMKCRMCGIIVGSYQLMADLERVHDILRGGQAHVDDLDILAFRAIHSTTPPMKTALACRDLLRDKKMTQTKIGEMHGISKSQVGVYCQLAKYADVLPDGWKDALGSTPPSLSLSHFQEIAPLLGEEGKAGLPEYQKIFADTLAEGWPLTKLREKLAELKYGTEPTSVYDSTNVAANTEGETSVNSTLTAALAVVGYKGLYRPKAARPYVILDGKTDKVITTITKKKFVEEFCVRAVVRQTKDLGKLLKLGVQDIQAIFRMEFHRRNAIGVSRREQIDMLCDHWGIARPAEGTPGYANKRRKVRRTKGKKVEANV
jgi:hypothetical protein